jgi:hypothetical protein
MLMGCGDVFVDGSGNEIKDDIKGVPEGIRPEDAKFWLQEVNGSQLGLTIRLSRANICDRNEVPSGTEYVTVDVRVPLGMSVKPGTYMVEGSDFTIGIALSETAQDACGGGSGLGASRGTVTLTKVADDEVQGSFDGVNEDTKLHVTGTFVARPCPSSTLHCL